MTQRFYDVWCQTEQALYRAHRIEEVVELTGIPAEIIETAIDEYGEYGDTVYQIEPCSASDAALWGIH